jgi:hypothetical protein
MRKLQQVVTNQQAKQTNYEKETIRVTGPKIQTKKE